MFIFLMAVLHIFVSVVVVVLSNYRVKLWARWSKEDDLNAQA
jgi:hypothetical protein